MILSRTKKVFPFFHFHQFKEAATQSIAKKHISFERRDGFWFLLKTLNVRVLPVDPKIITPVYIQFEDVTESKILDDTGNKNENEKLGTPAFLMNQNPMASKSSVADDGFINFESNFVGIPAKRTRLFKDSAIYNLNLLIDNRQSSAMGNISAEVMAYGLYIPDGSDYQQGML